jgi:hypothetical protein
MSRVYAWDGDEPYPNASELFQRSVENAIKGTRGQTLLREIEEALLMLPDKRLLSYTVCEDGKVCTLGAVAILRAMKQGKTFGMAAMELEDAAVKRGQGHDDEGKDRTFRFLKKLLDVKGCLAWTLVYENDEHSDSGRTRRYDYMLKWVQDRIIR